MSSEIKRIGWHGVHGMREDANGDYVLHSDHEAEIARLRADIEDYMMGAAAEAREVDARGEEIKRLRAEVEANRVDAERYRWLRDQPWRDNEELEPVIRLHLNALWDDKIDAAMGASA